MTIVLSLLLAMASDMRPLEPRDWIQLDYDYRRQAWELTCHGFNNTTANRRFEQLFGERMEHTRMWMENRFTTAAIEDARRRELPDGFIMVGGCRIPASAETVEGGFRRTLTTVERRIRAEERR